LWEGLGIAEGASDEDYCRLHELTEGVSDFLASDHGAGLACLSNDVSEWSAALRRRFGIEDAFEVWLISGDLGCKKPDREIYEVAAQRLGADGDAVLFVDDRPGNLDVAAERGWLTVQFGGEPSDHRAIQSFAELPPLISAWS
jgi:HAD superfamily hydrolase (TIGR01509 family)